MFAKILHGKNRNPHSMLRHFDVPEEVVEMLP
jgi:hypothetical protein